MDIEIESLLKKGVVVESYHEPGEYISPIFATEKSDGGYRLILNLKKHNRLAEYKKFKMETISTILCLIRPNCFMAKGGYQGCLLQHPNFGGASKTFKVFSQKCTTQIYGTAKWVHGRTKEIHKSLETTFVKYQETGCHSCWLF